VNFTGIDGVEVRGAGAGTIALRWGSPDAEPFATAQIASSGWSAVAADVTAFPSGTGELFVTSTGGVDLDTLEFLGAGVTDVTAPSVDAALTPAEPAGDNGWYTGAVTVQLSAQDNGALASVERSLDGGATWQNIRNGRSGAIAPISLTADGVHEVLYRATDTGRNVSEVGSVTVKIDSGAPQVAVTGVAEGDELGSSGVVTLGVDASDATSGVASATLTLDGEVVEPGEVELWTLALGSHELVATATDEAGHTAETVVTFTVTTSLADLSAHVDRLAAAGELTTAEASNLDAFLSQAERHAQAGRDAKQAAALQRFADATDEEVLVRDAEALLADLG
jgi:hypothetical protein